MSVLYRYYLKCLLQEGLDPAFSMMLRSACPISMQNHSLRRILFLLLLHMWSRF